MARSGQIQALLGDDFVLVHVAPTGDCFYECVARAVASSADHTSSSDDDDNVTPSSLRSIVASSLTTESLELFRAAHEAGVSGFEFMRKVNDLETLKERHVVSGREAGGAGQCIWANDFCIRTVATALRICVHIIDEEAGRPAVPGRKRGGRKRRRTDDAGDTDASSSISRGKADADGGAARRHGSFVTIQPEIASDSDQGDGNIRHICLQRTRRQHFNLIAQRDGKDISKAKKVGIFDVMPPRMQELWGLCRVEK